MVFSFIKRRCVSLEFKVLFIITECLFSWCPATTEICPGLHIAKMHSSFEKHKKVSSFINCQRNKYNSVKHEVIWKWRFVMLLIKSVVTTVRDLPVWTRIGHDLVVVEGRKCFSKGRVMMIWWYVYQQKRNLNDLSDFHLQYDLSLGRSTNCVNTPANLSFPLSSPGDLPLISAF